MNHSPLFWLVLGGSAAMGWSQNTEAEAKRMMDKVRQEIQSEREALSAQRDAVQNRRELLTQRLRDADQQLAALRTQTAQLNSQATAQSAQNQALVAQAKSYDARKVALTKALANVVDPLIADAQLGFPGQREARVNRLRELKQTLATGQLPPQEAMNRIWAAVLERARVGQGAESWSGSMALDPQKSTNLKGRYIRLGAAFQAFVAEDSSKSYVMRREGSDWKWSEIPAGSAAAKALLDASAVSEGKTEPRLVRVPLFVRKAVR